MRRRDFLRFALAGGAAAAAAPAAAQSPWPAHTARFIVPFAAGGAIDIPARLIADRLSRDLAASFIVENRPGAGGAIGAQAVVQWPPDGSGFLFTSSSVAILPALRPNLGFDPQHDLMPISVVCDVPTALLVPAKSRFVSVAQVIAEARAKPGKLTYGSGGVGSSNHLAGASFASTAGIDLLHVPYRGTAPGAERDLRRPDRHDVRADAGDARLRQAGRLARARRRHAAARAGAARRAGDRRDRAGLRGLQLVRDLRAGAPARRPARALRRRRSRPCATGRTCRRGSPPAPRSCGSTVRRRSPSDSPTTRRAGPR